MKRFKNYLLLIMVFSLFSSCYQETNTLPIEELIFKERDLLGSKYLDFDENKKNVIFEDFFSDNKNKWKVANSTSYRSEIKHGIYRIENNSENYRSFSLPVDFDQTKNFELEAYLKIKRGRERERGAGIYLGDENNGISIMISPNQHFVIKKVTSQSVSIIKDWSKTTSLKNEYNKITIRKVGSWFYFFINKDLCFRVPYQISVEEFGFLLASDTTLEADVISLKLIN